MLLICGFAVNFNFFTANPQMFAVRNRFANPQTKTLSPQFADLRTGLRKCPALVITKHSGVQDFALFLGKKLADICGVTLHNPSFHLGEVSNDSIQL